MIELTLAEARSIAIQAQGLHLTQPPGYSGRQVLESLGCIQLDTIHVVRRSHELVLLARGVHGGDAAASLQESSLGHFEYWAHAACLIPLQAWPLFAFRRRGYLHHGWSGPTVEPEAVRYVRAAVGDVGRVTVTDLGGARGSGWDREAPAKWAAEWLLATGELACVSRRGWTRVYQAATSVLPDDLLSLEPTNEQCIAGLVQMAIAALGIGTVDDIADYFRLPKSAVQAWLLDIGKFEQVAVQGWADPAWASPEALMMPEIDERACTPLSPFDSLVWHRPRAKRLFGVDYLLEAYKPAAKRECGYFGMPVLAGDRIVGRIALRTAKGIAQLEGHQVVDGEDPAHLHRAVHTAAAWAGATVVAAEPLCPPTATSQELR